MAMHSATDEPAHATAIAFAHHVAGLWEDISAIASLASTCWVAWLMAASAPVTATSTWRSSRTIRLRRSELDLIHQKAAAYSAELASKLSLFWTDPSFSAGRFPPLDRADYIDHAVTLVERRRVVLRAQQCKRFEPISVQEPFRNWSSMVDRFNALDELPIDEHKRYLQALLYPARFLYSWAYRSDCDERRCGGVRSIPWGRRTRARLIERALRRRNEGLDPLALFRERPALLRLRDICRERIAQG